MTSKKLPDISQLPLQTVNPKFLRSNATSHDKGCGAAAELVDNAVDAGADRLDIDYNIATKSLCFTDDGLGMTSDALLKMLGLGHCSKARNQIGQYGNGFKSGAMSLGRDVIVFTRARSHGTLQDPVVAMLSYTFLSTANVPHVVVPILKFSRKGKGKGFAPHSDGISRASLEYILHYSPFKTEAALTKQLEAVSSGGTHIVIYNLSSIDFDSDPHDIRFPGKPMPFDPEKSLRDYLSILYLDPQIDIYIRGKLVHYHNVMNSLLLPRYTEYTVTEKKKRSTDEEEDICKCKIVFGFNVGFEMEFNDPRKGLFLYHRGRLITFLQPVGLQHTGSSVGHGVFIVADVGDVAQQKDLLTVTQNKQTFEHNQRYRDFISFVSKKLADYWYTIGIDKPHGGIGITNFKQQILIPAKRNAPSYAFCRECHCFRYVKEPVPSDNSLWTCASGGLDCSDADLDVEQLPEGFLPQPLTEYKPSKAIQKSRVEANRGVKRLQTIEKEWRDLFQSLQLKNKCVTLKRAMVPHVYRIEKNTFDKKKSDHLLRIIPRDTDTLADQEVYLSEVVVLQDDFDEPDHRYTSGLFSSCGVTEDVDGDDAPTSKRGRAQPHNPSSTTPCQCAKELLPLVRTVDAEIQAASPTVLVTKLVEKIKTLESQVNLFEVENSLLRRSNTASTSLARLAALTTRLSAPQ